MTETPRDAPGVVMPPPILFGGCLVLGLLLDWAWPADIVADRWQYWIGAALVVLGLALMMTGFAALKRAGTHVDPYKPTTAIVTDGPYRFSRNPLYIGLFLLYYGIGIAVDTAWLLGLAVPLYVVMVFGVIEREERYLEHKFGQPYLSYKASVRRWL